MDKTYKIGYLLIHGFGGNTYEVKPLEEYLLKRSFRVESPSLKGHTGNKEDLKKYTYREWIVSAMEGYKKLTTECDKIVVIGFSMGGLIAFQIASKQNVHAIVTINTPIYYWDIKQITKNITEDLRAKRFDSIKKYIESTTKLPIYALINFRLLLSNTKNLLKGITCPILLNQALDDDTVKNTSVHYIHSRINSKEKVIALYEEGGHQILQSKSSNSVIKNIMNFVDQYSVLEK